jgi:hypothetical protein
LASFTIITVVRGISFTALPIGRIALDSTHATVVVGVDHAWFSLATPSEIIARFPIVTIGESHGERTLPAFTNSRLPARIGSLFAFYAIGDEN